MIRTLSQQSMCLCGDSGEDTIFRCQKVVQFGNGDSSLVDTQQRPHQYPNHIIQKTIAFDKQNHGISLLFYGYVVDCTNGILFFCVICTKRCKVVGAHKVLCRLLHQRNIHFPPIEQFQIGGKRILAFAVVDPVHIFLCLAAEPCMKLRRHFLHPINGNILRQIPAGSPNEVPFRQLFFRLHGEAVLLGMHAGVCSGAALYGHRLVEQL